MSEEINSYRFGRGEESTDKMLAQIKHEAVVDAKKSFAGKIRKFNISKDGFRFAKSLCLIPALESIE